MLVLSRRAGESIKIGDDVEIQVLSCRGNRVQLGLKAPRNTPIKRAELTEFLGLDCESPMGSNHEGIQATAVPSAS